jgi:hypothetical protein
VASPGEIRSERKPWNCLDKIRNARYTILIDGIVLRLAAGQARRSRRLFENVREHNLSRELQREADFFI